MTPKPKSNPAQMLANPQAKKAFEAAKRALEDPANRELLIAQAKKAGQVAQAWWQERRHEADTKQETSDDDSLSQRGVFGQKRLESRTRHVAALVESLSSGSTDAASALAPVREGISQVQNALNLAAGLPIVKRKLAHRQIDYRLDSYERMLLAVTLPGAAK